jgi:hypothetical protein
MLIKKRTAAKKERETGEESTSSHVSTKYIVSAERIIYTIESIELSRSVVLYAEWVTCQCTKISVYFKYISFMNALYMNHSLLDYINVLD